MKTKEKKIKDKSVTEQLREIRDEVSIEIQDMSLEQLKEYLKKKKTLHSTAHWQ